MIATLPLHNCRMFASRRINHQSLWRGQTAIDRDRTRLRTAIETNAAPRTVLPGVPSWMNAVSIQFRQEHQTFWRTRLNTEPAPFALCFVDSDSAPCLRKHDSPRCHHFCSLGTLQPFGLLTVLVQLVTKLRMRDLDQRFGPLTDRLAMEIRNSEFRHDVTNQPA